MALRAVESHENRTPRRPRSVPEMLEENGTARSIPQ